MENGNEEQGPNPVVFRMVWGLVALVAVGCVWVVWDAYQTQVHRNQGGIFDAEAPEAAFHRPAEKDLEHQMDAPLGEISLGLKANLKAIETAVPDRPHNPNEVRSRTIGDEFKRRRSFTISTDANGIRIPDSWAGRNHSYIGKKKGYRIVAMGASESFGWGGALRAELPGTFVDLAGGRSGQRIGPGGHFNRHGSVGEEVPAWTRAGFGHLFAASAVPGEKPGRDVCDGHEGVGGSGRGRPIGGGVACALDL